MPRHVLPLVLLLLVGCYDDIDIDQLCLPSDEGCGSFDYDGDGVANGSDDFPEDATCAVRDDDNCTACGEGCTDLEVCDGVGACVCPEAHYAPPECVSCLPEFTGASCHLCADPRHRGGDCDECVDPHYALPDCTSCLPEFAGASCDACSDLNFAGVDCDECADPHYALPDCTSCLPEFMGASCDECSDPKFTGGSCDECADPLRAQPECTSCLPPYTGTNCDELVIVPGTFTMGSPLSEECRYDGEIEHKVTLTHSFALKPTELTLAQWQSLIGNNPSAMSAGCGDCPVEMVNWYEALSYCNALSIAEGIEPCYTLVGCNGLSPGAGMECLGVTVTASNGDVYDCEGYRLPTEAEWEYAARAGTTEATYNGDIAGWNCDSVSSVLEPIAWYTQNSGATTQAVAQKDANPWGLYDMLGNVWEWTWDRQAAYLGDVTDPVGSATGSLRVVRGCSWLSGARNCRVAGRLGRAPEDRFDYIGFRVARTLPD